jgi:hypothetical protein
MNKFVAFLAILALCVTETLTNPTGSDTDIDCEWAEWGPCEDIKCGIGSQVFRIFPSVQSKLVLRNIHSALCNVYPVVLDRARR